MEVRTVEICPGDVILLFTDGVTESANREGEMLGQERLCSLLADSAGLPMEKALQRILDAVCGFQVSQEDDMTLVLLRKTP